MSDAASDGAAPGASGPRVGSRQNRAFGLFWAARTLSATGDAVASMALPLFILDLTGSVAQMGLVRAAAGIAGLAGAFGTAMVVDRWSRQRLLVACDLVRAVLFALVPLAAWLLGAQPWLVYVAAIGAGALEICFQITHVALLPSLLSSGSLTAANGRLMMGFGVSRFVGPLLAGLVASRSGAAAIGMASVGFLASAILVGRIRSVTRRGEAAGPARAPRLRELSGGIRFIAGHDFLRSLLAMLTGFTFLLAGAQELLIFHLKHEMGGDDTAVGVVFAVASVGAIAGALLAASLRKRFGIRACFIGSLALQGVFGMLIALAPSMGTFAALAVCFAVANTSLQVYSLSIRQEQAPPDLLGRIASVFMMVGMTIGPVGAAAMTLVAEYTGARPVFAMTGALIVLIALLGLRNPVWRGREGRDDGDERAAS